MRNTLFTGLGGVGAAFFGGLCCAGPLVFATLGVGAGLGSAFEPLRPVFGILMIGMFALAFRTVYGKNGMAGEEHGAACAPGEACAVPRSRTREKVTLWSAVALAVVFWTLPTWSGWIV